MALYWAGILCAQTAAPTDLEADYGRIESPGEDHPTPRLFYVSQHSQIAEPVEADLPAGSAMPSRMPKGARDGVFQSAQFTATWLPPASGSSDPRVTELVTSAVFGFPAPTRESPLVVTPNVEVRFFSDMETLDIPGEVYDVVLEVRWLKQVSSRWGMDVGLAPGVHSDFEQTGDDAFRLVGRAIASYEQSPASKLVFGAVYLDRDDVAVLPVVGWIWTPSEAARLDLVFPKPRYARRLRDCGRFEDWCYLAGEFGGGAWSVGREDGSVDQLYMRDLRLLLGLERKSFGGLGSRLELGYVFGREFEYKETGTLLEPEGAFLLRAAFTY